MEQQYLDLCKDILENGIDSDDRTGVGTRSVFARQMRFDLSKGFPLLTTKKMFTRGMIEELLWFIRGSVDVTELEDKNVNFWSSWKRQDGTIGDGYGHQMRGIEYFKPVVPKLYKRPEYIKYPKWSMEIPDHDSEKMFNNPAKIRIGDIYEIPEFEDKITILKRVLNPKINRSAWLCQFHSNGHKKIVSYGQITRGKVKNEFYPSVSGVGYYGNIDIKSIDSGHKFLINTWRDMIKRCYDKNSMAYKSYGGKGVHVSEEWLNFSNFYKDVISLSKFSCKIEYPSEYSLDKDVLYASNRYGKDTCIWASKKEQDANLSNSKYFTAKSPDGRIEKFYSTGNMGRKYGINHSHIHMCLNKNLAVKKAKGWTNFEYMEEPDGMRLRYRNVDQLKETIAEIKNNPLSRRLIISLWNTHDIDYMELPCCHGNIIQFSIRGGKISCMMYQRSGDGLLGVPVNIASYALLTHMIAQVCDLEVGEFIHTIGDAHIYSNHFEQVEKQINRKPFPFPRLELNKDVKNIDDFTIDDIKIIGYKCHPAIKGEVAV